MKPIEYYNKLNAYLLAIYLKSKQMHYLVRGDQFWSTHQLFDEVSDFTIKQMDQIYELVYMAQGLPIPSPTERLENTMEILSGIDAGFSFESLFKLFTDCLSLCSNCEFNTTRTENALLDETSQHLSKGIAFIYYTMNNRDEVSNGKRPGTICNVKVG